MRRGPAGILIGVALAVALAASQERADAVGFKGKFEVQALEIGYVIGARTLKFRAVPFNGPTVELQTADPDTIDRLIRLAEVKSRGGRLAVEIDGNEIKAIDVGVGNVFTHAGQ